MELFDEFSKSLAEAVPRRESLRRLGTLFAGAVLAPLGLGTAMAGTRDPCKVFCKCGSSRQQRQCLEACRACGGNTSRIAGACGNYTCCAQASCNGACSNLSSDPNCGACGNDCGAQGETCCGNHCADLDDDIYNCGGCGVQCAAPAPGESVTCVFGACVYGCAAGTADCNGTCTDITSDPANCGACGNVCGADTPYCHGGECSEIGTCPGLMTWCYGECRDLANDSNFCGLSCETAVVCDVYWTCTGGACVPVDAPNPDASY
jgi:hypothetical protein